MGMSSDTTPQSWRGSDTTCLNTTETGTANLYTPAANIRVQYWNTPCHRPVSSFLRSFCKSRSPLQRAIERQRKSIRPTARYTCAQLEENTVHPVPIMKDTVNQQITATQRGHKKYYYRTVLCNLTNTLGHELFVSLPPIATPADREAETVKVTVLNQLMGRGTGLYIILGVPEGKHCWDCPKQSHEYGLLDCINPIFWQYDRTG